MDDSRARILIGLSDGKLEVEGSEEFVRSQIEALKPFITSHGYGQLRMASTSQNATAQPDSQGSEGSRQSAAEHFENLFAEADDRLQILRSLPGSNKAQKSVNAALLLAYGNMLNGEEATAFSDVRDLCKSHACLDSGNFAKTMKGQRELFIVNGSGAGQAIKLTVPGRRKAEALAQELNAE